ncbi:hypothetical protein [Paenibacillus pini]|nr:hypothetical protein [Paenibacillus pini]
MWEHIRNWIQQYPIPTLLILCVVLAVIYVAMHYEQLFYKE